MLKKFFVCILLFTLIYGITLVSYASLDFADTEAAIYEPPVIPVDTPSTPPDDSGTPIPDEPETTEVVETPVVLNINTKIEGLVFEDVIRVQNIGEEYNTFRGEYESLGTKQETNNKKYDSGDHLVSGVEVLDNDGLVMITDEDGAFSITGSGEHQLSFKYGVTIKDDEPYNYRLNKDTLKYNGQDYIMDIIGHGSSETEYSYIRKMRELKKSYTEVMILIDYSQSMYLTKDGKKKIDLVKESAVNFVNQLFAEVEGNLAVGFIAFSYDAAIIKSPTDVKEDVIDAIQNFEVEYGVVATGKYKGRKVGIWSNLNSGQTKTGTNIGAAVEKAQSGYLSSESNKVMVLFSDGAATAHRLVDPPYYRNDTETVKREKLDNVAKYTQQNLLNVVASDITLINILNKTDDVDEKHYIDKAFKKDGNSIGNLYEVEFLNREAIELALLNDVKEEIEKTLGEGVIVTEGETTSIKGDDREERREEVNNNFEKMNYENIKIFSLIDNLVGEEADVNTTVKYLDPENDDSMNLKKQLYKKYITSVDGNDEIETFIDNTWMIADAGTIELEHIAYDSLGRPSAVMCGSRVVDTITYYTTDEGEERCRTSSGQDGLASSIIINENTIRLNCALIKRDDFELELEKKITGVRITLSDGTVIYEAVGKAKLGDEEFDLNDYIKDYNKQIRENYKQILQEKANVIAKYQIDKIVKKNWKIQEVEEYIPNSVTVVLDTDILQGATIEVEYTFVVNNNTSGIAVTKGFSIVDYYDNGLIYRENGNLISEDGKNSDYGWKSLSIEELTDTNKINQYVKENGDTTCIYVNYNEAEYRRRENLPDDGVTSVEDPVTKYLNPRIQPNESRFAKVVLSRVLSAELLEMFQYENQAEIIEYGNNLFRRVNYTEQDSSGGNSKYIYPIPGNYVPKKGLQTLDDEFSHIGEIDTAVASPIQLLPPTGKSIDNKMLIVGGGIIFIAIISYIGARKIYKKRH